jgi:putative FmdB family regulatory protein
MPLYEFTCRKCGHQFEELVGMSDLEAGKVKCPACRSKRIEKGMSSFATGTAGAPSGSGAGGCGAGGFT